MQTIKNYHLVLVDDGSMDETETMVRSYINVSQMTIIKGKGDWWWAGCLQQGIDWLNKKKPPKTSGFQKISGVGL